MAKASPARSGDALAGIAAQDDAERVLAQMALADVPLKTFLSEALIPYEEDEVTRLIVDGTTRPLSRPSRISQWGFPQLAAVGHGGRSGARRTRPRPHARDGGAASRSCAIRI